MVRPSCHAVIILMCLLVLTAYGQTTSPREQKPSNVFRVGVDLVQLDVVVTDSDGNPVTDLTEEDFIVYQDGKPQKITNLSLIKIQEPVQRPPTVTAAPEKKEETRIIEPPPPPVDIRRDQVRRSIALVIDDLGLSFEGIVRARESAREWVDNEMKPGDLVAVITTMSGMGALQQFTADKRMLHAAIDRIVYTTHSRIGVSSFTAVGQEDFGLSDIMKEENDAALTAGTLESIRYVVNGLKSVPGRKSLILFSESLGMLSEGAEMSRTGVLSSDRQYFVRQYMQRLVDDAHRSAVVIHSIDPRGVVYTGGTAEDSYAEISGDTPEETAEAVQEAMRDVPGQRSLQLESSIDGMVELAHATGGLVFHNRNDINSALREAVNDGNVYYLIGYRPDAETVSKIEKGGRQFHSVRVRVKRPGMRVRSRSGFFMSPTPENQQRTRRERMADALLSPFNSGTLPVQLTTLFSQTKDRKLCINALLHFDTKQLRFTEEDGWQKAVVAILASTFDARGEQIDLQDRTWTIMAKGETFEEMNRKGVVYLMRIPVKKPGAYQMRVVLGDTESEQMGSASHFIEVPDLKKEHLELSGIALAALKSRPKPIEDQAEGLVADREVNGTAAVRIFQPGDTIMWAYQVLNAKPGADSTSKLQAYVRLFSEGREVYTEEPSMISGHIQEKSTPLIVSGRMELVRIPPGNYVLQAVVRDMQAKGSPQLAVQSINFEVRNPGLGSLMP